MESQKCNNGVIRYNDLLLYDWVSLDLRFILIFFLKKNIAGLNGMQIAKVCFLSGQEQVCFRIIQICVIWKRFTSLEERLFPNCWFGFEAVNAWVRSVFGKVNMYLITHSIYHFPSFSFATKLPNLAHKRPTHQYNQDWWEAYHQAVLIVLVGYKVGSPV